MHYRLGILHMDIIKKLRPGDNLMVIHHFKDQVKCHGWSTTMPRMVTHHSKDGNLALKIYQKEEYLKFGIYT